MKRFSQCLVLTTILVAGAIALPVQANPQQRAIETAMLVPSAPPQLVHVPTPDDLANVNMPEIVPPLEISAREARQWVGDAGYTAVSPMRLARTSDGQLVYRGTARANGETYAVIVDSWGNIAGWQ